MASFELNIKAMSLTDLEDAVAELHRRFSAVSPLALESEALASAAPAAQASGRAGTAAASPARVRRGRPPAGGLLGDVAATASAPVAGSVPADDDAAEGQGAGPAEGDDRRAGDDGGVGSEETAQADLDAGGAGASAETGQGEEAQAEEAAAPGGQADAGGETRAGRDQAGANPTLEDVKGAARACSKSRGVDQVQKVLGEFGAQKFTQIAETKYAEVIAKLNAAAG
jgi:hypothetical protein